MATAGGRASTNLQDMLIALPVPGLRYECWSGTMQSDRIQKHQAAVHPWYIREHFGQPHVDFQICQIDQPQASNGAQCLVSRGRIHGYYLCALGYHEGCYLTGWYRFHMLLAMVHQAVPIPSLHHGLTLWSGGTFHEILPGETIFQLGSELMRTNHFILYGIITSQAYSTVSILLWILKVTSQIKIQCQAQPLHELVIQAPKGTRLNTSQLKVDFL